jgi:phosphopantetheine--protein transferase-like protein
LPPVGNDIVDLAAPDNPGKSGDDRFCGRVFTADERALITGAPRPDALLWTLWAAKEAAYKAVSRSDPSVCSIPRQYPVILEQGDETKENAHLAGRVITPRGELALRIVLAPEWVHALAAGSEEVLDRIYSRVEAPGGVDDPSTFVRKGLLREISRLLDCGAQDLSVIEDPDCHAAPGVLFRGCPLTKEVSLSHDGRFAAFAFDPLALIFSDLFV